MELRRVELTSSQLRCLANTTRSRLLAALRLEGPATSASLAERLGTNTGVTSYHLRRLADAGLIVDDPELGRGRERVWRAAHDVTVWTETAFDGDPDDRAARDWMIGHRARLANAWRQEWLETRDDWSVEWRDAACTSDMMLRLSPERTKALVDELESVIERYAADAKGDSAGEAGDGGESGPGEADSRVAAVAVLLDVFPSHRLTI